MALKNNLTFLTISFNVSAMAFHLQFFIAYFFFIFLNQMCCCCHFHWLSQIRVMPSDWAHPASTMDNTLLFLLRRLFVLILVPFYLLLYCCCFFTTSAIIISGNRLVFIDMSLKYMIVFDTLSHGNVYVGGFLLEEV